jgi:RNA polymerase sigma factor (sigma-70 family)
MRNEVQELLPTRKTLLSRLRAWDDHESWNQFFETYWRFIYGAALKSGLTESEAQEVVQETVISVSKSMPSFRYDPNAGSFKGWLMQLTRWRIADQVRKRNVEERFKSAKSLDDTRRTATVDRLADPMTSDLESGWESEWEDNLLHAAIERVKRKADLKQYQIFDLYVLKQWPVNKVANALQVSSGQVYLAKHRISALLKKELSYLQTKVC